MDLNTVVNPVGPARCVFTAPLHHRHVAIAHFRAGLAWIKNFVRLGHLNLTTTSAILAQVLSHFCSKPLLLTQRGQIWLLLSLLCILVGARHGRLSMSPDWLCNVNAGNQPVEQVSIPLDDDTDSLVSVAATCAVCGECCSGNMVHIPCCDHAAASLKWGWRMRRTFSLVVLHGAICDAWPHVC